MGGMGGGISASSSSSLDSTSSQGVNQGNNNSGAINFAPTTSANITKTVTIALVAAGLLGGVWLFTKTKN